MNNREVILLNITGEDKPGITSSLTAILAHYNIPVLDIGQAVIHDNLNLGILFEVPPGSESSTVLKDLLFKAYELGVQARFTPISADNYDKWVHAQGKERNIITLIARQLSSAQLAAIADVIYKQRLNIDIITRLTGRPSLKSPDSGSVACVEFSVRGTPVDKHVMKKDFLEISKNIEVDIAFQEDNIFRRNRRLVCFDMDSTLIRAEVIEELGALAGHKEKIHAITEAAMRGEIDFTESFKQRITLLKGIRQEQLQGIAEKLPLTDGAEKLVHTLSKYGFKTAILSGGFTFFGNFLKNKLGIDYVYANELEIKNGELTGNYTGDIVDGPKKAELLKFLAKKERIHLEQVIAVGDGANDLPMLELAGLGIAFHAKPVVKASAKQAISTLGIDAVLYLMGFRDRELM
ncbi:MAG: phosphoserine phosphatase SerB [Candidatus Aminicenantes bacterium]|nr:phosphoserine phosphatase SerB [Candidatus Aminicenantes bacterium]